MSESPTLAPPRGAVGVGIDDFTYTPPGRTSPALSGLSLEIPPGERVLLTGASGSGKSTILKALSGLIPEDPPEGTDPSVPLPEPSPVPGVTLMVQNPVHSFVGATAGIDTAFGPENASVDPARMPEVVRDAHAAAAFSSPLEANPYHLSGGQQQRLSLAGLLATGSGAYALDEPLAMLDEATALAVRDAICAATKGLTLIVADHQVELWLDHVDRVIRIGEGGRILEDVSAQTWRSSGARSDETFATSHACAQRTGDDSALIDLEVPATLEGRTLFAGPVHVELYTGELAALTGPSGIGKSTLIRYLLEETRERTGRGKRAAKKAPFRAAWLPQNPEQSFVARTVLDEVKAGAEDPSDDEAARAWLEATGLAHLESAGPFTLSGGEQRRLAFATALASGRDILVLDEPTVGLDDAAFGAVAELIARALVSGRAVLAATHDERLVRACDRVIALEAAPGRDDLRESIACQQPSDSSPAPPIPRVPHPPRAVAADKLNPLTILAIAVLAFAGSFGMHTLAPTLTGTILTLMLIPLAWRTPARLMARLAPIVLAALTIAWSAGILSGRPLGELSTWQGAGVEGLRIFAMVGPGAILLEGLDPTRFGQALAQKCHVPARFAAAMSAGLARLGHVFSQWGDIVFTRRIRGIQQRNSFALYAGATFALLVSTLRGAEIQALAMDARGFATAQRRTWVHDARFTWHDAWGLGLGIVLLAAPIIATLVA
ncbi:ATP-binding cassette domain-containing protein [Dermabacter sp. HSID17554]|uniref:ATP-binding cassette domain-containing protein n=1 Tax=Dermabacter sp. HSID17554 TaxID=2419511 RepID=UPI000F85CB08|nr:ATP-binding cassette domain-containing protein [Dermabacter sp. HSID17554]RUP86028.1 ATP-binding cassette domain-containing protein [Dermabacter sp. HSID17554]